MAPARAHGVAVVTGAASGIGRALCAILAERGARVIATDVDGEGAARVAAQLPNARAAALDVVAAGEVEAFAADTFARESRVDLWINNAGIGIGGEAHELGLEDWQRVLDVNLRGAIHGVLAAYPRMVRQGSGHLVNVASVAGLAPYPLALPYTTSKHAVVGLSRALRAEARGHGVRVSVACPGMIDTPIWQRSAVRGGLAAGRDRLLAKLRVGTTADACARAILRGVDANRGTIVVTAEAHAAWWLARLSPSLADWVGHQVAGYVRRVARPA